MEIPVSRVWETREILHGMKISCWHMESWPACMQCYTMYYKDTPLILLQDSSPFRTFETVSLSWANTKQANTCTALTCTCIVSQYIHVIHLLSSLGGKRCCGRGFTIAAPPSPTELTSVRGLLDREPVSLLKWGAVVRQLQEEKTLPSHTYIPYMVAPY